MTNPVYHSFGVFSITGPGQHVPNGITIQSGFDYVLWVSGTFGSCTVLPQWIDAVGVENNFTGTTVPFTTAFNFSYTCPPGSLCITVGGTGTCALNVTITEKVTKAQ